ncbi:MAG TPA: sialate O-acetylesterase, partial [Gammaproteobacteria bacterium]|nr:sialate O-acetylesterase [Gammaproteobacteria bacterium]
MNTSSPNAERTSSTVANANMPLFLFAGQSNMQGNVDPVLFKQLVNILVSHETDPTKIKQLQKALNSWYLNYQGGYARYAYNPQVSAMESRNLVAMRNNGLINAKFPQPPINNLAYCTDTTDPAVPLAATCGNPFGPELLFSRALAKNSVNPFTIVKVVEGGTSLAVDWISPSASNGHPGPMYQQLAARIASLRNDPQSIHQNCDNSNACAFKAFVWFQGENDCFNESDATSYASNLKHFISDVRGMLGDPNFPVVIVQIGYWPTTLPYGAPVIQAQADFVKNTPNTTLVTTADLSQYYHFDPAAQ